MNTVINYQTYTSFNRLDSKLFDYLNWWSEKTKVEPKMLEKSVNFFLDNLVFAIFAFDGNKLVGAAGLIPCLNRHKQKMYFESQLVLELASNYVEPEYRCHHVGTEFVLQRLEFCKNKGYFPVSVTGNNTVKQIFGHLGVVMDNIHGFIPGLTSVYHEVRVCECRSEEKNFCKVCPKKDRNIWAFTVFLPEQINSIQKPLKQEI